MNRLWGWLAYIVLGMAFGFFTDGLSWWRWLGAWCCAMVAGIMAERYAERYSHHE